MQVALVIVTLIGFVHPMWLCKPCRVKGACALEKYLRSVCQNHCRNFHPSIRFMPTCFEYHSHF